MSKTFDTTPLARMLEGMAAEKWNVTGAISELIDNALGDARGDAKSVMIIYDKRERKLTVRDDGKGMDRIGSLFQIGRTVGISATDIGIRGMGGTKALVWLAEQVSIHTMRDDGSVMRDIVRWKDHINSGKFPQVSDEWEEPNGHTPTALKETGHGTQIDMLLRPGRALKEDQIQRELARIYSCGLRHGKQISWLTISSRKRDHLQHLKAVTFPMPSDPSKIVKFKLDIPSDVGPLRAEGLVALVEDHPYKDSVVALGFGHRTILSTRRCYSNADSTQSYGGAGVVGYADLIGGGWKPKLTTTKEDFDDTRVFDALMHQVFVLIEPLLQQTERNRFQVVLSELALDLTAAFNGINNPDFNLGGEKGGTGQGQYGAAGPGSFREDVITPPDNVVRIFKPIKTPKVVDPSRKGPYPGGNQQPPAARLELRPVPDKDIDQALCRLTITSPHDTNLQVEINEDHDIVEELLKPKALNKMALAMMITREVASALIQQPVTLDHVLSKRLREKLNTMTDDRARERLLARLLMDSVKRPQIEEEAVA